MLAVRTAHTLRSDVICISASFSAALTLIALPAGADEFGFDGHRYRDHGSSSSAAAAAAAAGRDASAAAAAASSEGDSLQYPVHNAQLLASATINVSSTCYVMGIGTTIVEYSDVLLCI